MLVYRPKLLTHRGFLHILAKIRNIFKPKLLHMRRKINERFWAAPRMFKEFWLECVTNFGSDCKKLWPGCVSYFGLHTNIGLWPFSSAQTLCHSFPPTHYIMIIQKNINL